MRSASLLLLGLTLLGGGIAVLLSDLAGRWWLGVVLILAGLLFKVGGFLLTDQPDRARSGARPPARRNGHHTDMSRMGLRTGSGPTFRPAPSRPASSRARATPPSAPSTPARPFRRAS